METIVLISVLPVVAAIVAMVLPSLNWVRRLVPLTCWLQLIFIAYLFSGMLGAAGGAETSRVLAPGFVADRISVLFMLLTSFVAACSLTHAAPFFEKENGEQPAHERTFYLGAVLFLLAMLFVFLCDNIGYLWISVEATTLTSTLLVYHARTKHALEATWKYVIICSVGIAFALLGTVLIFASSQHGATQHGTMSLTELLQVAPQLDFPLLRFGFIFCLLGYGTKAGVFPLHSWLPDAHSEAPAPASAMLSGSLLNCALFAIWRLTELVNAANHGPVGHVLPLTMGAVTAVAASFFLVRQHGIKRLWAYSSVENVGLMLAAIGLGSAPLFFLQALNHSVAKVGLFLLAGNFVQATGTKKLSEIHGILESSPVWGIAFALCAFAVTGAPPFGAFVSEWLILMKTIDLGEWPILIALVFALALSFVAVSVHVGKVLFGVAREQTKPFAPLMSSLIPCFLAACAIAAGLTTLPSYMVLLK